MHLYRRLNKDSLGEGHTGIDWGGVRRALTDWKVYTHSVRFPTSVALLSSLG